MSSAAILLDSLRVKVALPSVRTGMTSTGIRAQTLNCMVLKHKNTFKVVISGKYKNLNKITKI